MLDSQEHVLLAGPVFFHEQPTFHEFDLLQIGQTAELHYPQYFFIETRNELVLSGVYDPSHPMDALKACLCIKEPNNPHQLWSITSSSNRLMNRAGYILEVSALVAQGCLSSLD